MSIIKRLESVSRRILPTFVYLRLRRITKFTINFTTKLSTKFFVKDDHKYNIPLFSSFNILQDKIKPESVSLVICCAFQGRHEILRQSIMESFESKYKSSIRWFLCGSDSQDESFINQLSKELDGKVCGLIWRNNPLGEKWQAAVSFSRFFFDAELLAITGSDDILSYKLIDTIVDKHFASQLKVTDSDVALYCTDTWSIASLNEMDALSPNLMRCKINKSNYYIPLGAGRFYTKKFLKEINYILFDVQLNSCLDDHAYHKAVALEKTIVLYPRDYGLLLSVKGNWSQMNSIKTIIDSSSIETKEYSVREYQVLKQCLSEDTFSKIFNNNKNLSFTWN